MKIGLIHFGSYMEVGGIGTHVYLLSKGLAKMKIEILCINVGSMNSKVEIENVRVLTVASSRNDLKTKISSIVKVLAYEKPNAVHMHGFAETSLAPLFRKIKASYIFSPHNIPRRSEDKRLLNNPIWNRIVAVSKYHANTILSAGAAQEKVAIVPNGVDTFLFRPDINSVEMRKKLGLSSEDTMILVPTRLHREKGVDIIIRAIPLILHRLSNVKVLITGNGSIFQNESYYDYLKSLVKKLQIEDRMMFGEGRFTYEEMPQIYAASSVVVLPSRRETFGYALIEAMATGKPIVATRVGGIPDIVSPDVGILVRPNPRELAFATMRLLEDKSLSTVMGETGRKLVSEKYSVKAMVNKMLSLYKECTRTIN